VKKIILISAPYQHLYGSVSSLVSFYFPLGLGYIASFLEKNGYSVSLIAEDGQTNVFDEVARQICDDDLLYVGISSMTASFPAALKLARMIKNKIPDVPIAIGGPHAAALKRIILDNYSEFDFVCFGEGELTALEIAESLSGRSSISDVTGIIWRNSESGAIIENPPRAFHQSLDDFPYPARHLVNFQNYSLHSSINTSGKVKSATILTSRGCPYQCLFCATHLTAGRKHRFHSEEYILGELRFLKERYGIKHVFFEDEVITVNRARLNSLCRAIIDNNLDMVFSCFSRVDIFDEPMAELLKSAGFRMVIFGVESGAPEILKQMNKGASLDQARKAIDICKKYDLKSYAIFIVGLPFETLADVRQTIKFAFDLDASMITINPFVPFPGTPLFSMEDHYPKTVDGWAKFLMTSAPPFDMVPGVSGSKLQQVINQAHLKYYIRPNQIFRFLKRLKSFDEFPVLVKAFWMILKRSINKI